MSVLLNPSVSAKVPADLRRDHREVAGSSSEVMSPFVVTELWQGNNLVFCTRVGTSLNRYNIL